MTKATPSATIAAEVDVAWTQLRQPELEDAIAEKLCRFIVANARDARRDTARDILAVIEGNKNV